MKFLTAFVHLVVYSNIWVSLCAATLTGATPCLHGNNFSWLSFALVFSATLAAYNFQRLSRLNTTDGINESAMVTWLLKHRQLLLVFIVLGGLGTVVSLFFLRWEILLLLMPLALISMAYSVRLFFQQDDKNGLRDIPGIKIFLIAATWAGATYIFPLVQQNGLEVLQDTSLWVFTFERFLFIIAITLPFDIRDVDYDDPSKKTIPQLLGTRTSIVIAALSLVASFAILLFVRRPDEMLLELDYFTIGIAYLITMLLITYSSAKRSDLYFTGGVEAASLIVGISYCL